MNNSTAYIPPAPVFTAVTIRSTDPLIKPPTYSVHAISENPIVIGKIYKCRVRGTLNANAIPSIAESNDFEIEFDPCQVPIESCFADNWDDPVTLV